MKLEDLKSAADELNETLFDPKREISNLTNEEYVVFVKKAIPLLVTDENKEDGQLPDELTESTQKVVDIIKSGESFEIEESKEENVDELARYVYSIDKLDVLKNVVRSEDKFTAIRDVLPSYKTVIDLKKVMFSVLDKEFKDPSEIEDVLPGAKNKKEYKKTEGTRAEVFASIFHEGIPMTMDEYSQEMLRRYKKSSTISSNCVFTNIYVNFLVTLGYMKRTIDGKFVKA